jgi:hypothetical protein
MVKITHQRGKGAIGGSLGGDDLVEDRQLDHEAITVKELGTRRPNRCSGAKQAFSNTATMPG